MTLKCKQCFTLQILAQHNIAVIESNSTKSEDIEILTYTLFGVGVEDKSFLALLATAPQDTVDELTFAAMFRTRCQQVINSVDWTSESFHSHREQ